MRARLSVLFAGLTVELREVALKSKPARMLAISPKGTVPVLHLPTGQVIEESYDIMRWALAQSDPHVLLDVKSWAQAEALIQQNDHEFKYWLDRYKYTERYGEMSQTGYRQRGEAFLQALEARLAQHPYLLSERVSIADLAIMPFVRQFAHVDRDAFAALPYPHLQRWLNGWLAHPYFLRAMVKFKPWQEADEPIIFPASLTHGY